jgi:hypothetical protein
MPADTTAIRFEVNGSERVGIYYLAETEQPAPFALFLHGMPGSEKNHDIAQALRASGWHVLVIHFGGTWGSAGDYDLRHHPAEAVAALDFALSYPAKIDSAKIAVLGYSMGSRAALLSAHDESRFKAIVSLAGFSDFSEVLLDPSFYPTVIPFLRGATESGMSKQMASIGNGLQPYEAIVALAPRPVLVVHGTQDEVVPYFYGEALAGTSEHVTFRPIDGANHAFAAHRAELVTVVCDFLTRWANG